MDSVRQQSLPAGPGAERFIHVGERDVLLAGESNAMVGLVGNAVGISSLDVVVNQKRGLDVSLYELEAIMATRLAHAT